MPVLAFISFPFRNKEIYSLINQSTGQKPGPITWIGKFSDRGKGSGFRTIPSFPIKPFGCPSIHKLPNKYCLLPVSLPKENFLLTKIFSKVLSPSYPTGMPLFGQVLKSICLCLNLQGRRVFLDAWDLSKCMTQIQYFWKQGKCYGTVCSGFELFIFCQEVSWVPSG